MVIEGYRVARTYPKDAGSLANKLTRMGAVSPLASMHCTANAHMHAHKFKAHVWNVQLRFTMNALPTDKRRSQAKMEVIGRASPHSDSPFPCHLCGAGEDSTAHFWTDCKVVADVIAAVGAAAQTSIKQELNHGLLVFDPQVHPKRGRAIIALNYALWTQRTQYFVNRHTLPKHSTAVTRIVECCLDAFPSQLAGKRVSTSPAIEAIVKSPPPQALAIFTDGSALGNPGPTGAGMYIQAPLPGPAGSSFKLWISIGLGHGSNNLGEAGALFYAMKVAPIIIEGLGQETPDVLLITDSMLCVGFLSHGWGMEDRLAINMAYAARHKFNTQAPTPRIYWVRGHAKIPGNEEADACAKAGASYSKNDALLSEDRPHLTLEYDMLSPPRVIELLRSAGYTCTARPPDP